MRTNTRALVDEIAKERMHILFGLAERRAATDGALSRAYVGRIKKISTHYKVSVPRGIRNRICKKCGSVLIPGLTAKVRIASSRRHVVYACTRCKAEKHVSY